MDKWIKIYRNIHGIIRYTVYIYMCVCVLEYIYLYNYITNYICDKSYNHLSVHEAFVPGLSPIQMHKCRILRLQTGCGVAEATAATHMRSEHTKAPAFQPQRSVCTSSVLGTANLQSFRCPRLPRWKPSLSGTRKIFTTVGPLWPRSCFHARSKHSSDQTLLLLPPR